MPEQAGIQKQRGLSIELHVATHRLACCRACRTRQAPLPGTRTSGIPSTTSRALAHAQPRGFGAAFPYPRRPFALSLTMGGNGLFVRSEAPKGRSAAAAGRSMLSRHAGGGQHGAWHMVLAACGADRKTAADGMRAIFDESGGAVGWRATGSASWPQQLDLAIAG